MYTCFEIDFDTLNQIKFLKMILLSVNNPFVCLGSHAIKAFLLFCMLCKLEKSVCVWDA